MNIEQLKWSGEKSWELSRNGNSEFNPNLVFAFGGRDVLTSPERYQELKERYPQANILTCSTSGEILGQHVFDDTIIASAVEFNKTGIKISQTDIRNCANSFEAGRQLASELKKEDLITVFVLSDGQLVNGSELVKGLNHELPQGIGITGGLAGDGPRFQKTLVGCDAPPDEGKIIAVGFYGHDLKVGHGSHGGWDPFGPEREITRSEGNVLYELDGQSALDLYKKYLGDKADGLPGTALLFPLSVQLDSDQPSVVRTILSIDEENKSMIFAGDVPEGSRARLMKANFDRLIDGAITAAHTSFDSLDSFEPELAILISCVGRKLVLNHRVEEEVEGVIDVIGQDAAITGFYSYGEISPFQPSARCELHNQTMTITTFAEN